MTEAQVTKRLLAEVRRRLPQAVVLKHADRFTAGVPDFSVTTGARTTWFEVKLAPGAVTPLQREMLRRLGRAYVVTFAADGKTATVTNWKGELACGEAPSRCVAGVVERLASE